MPTSRRRRSTRTCRRPRCATCTGRFTRARGRQAEPWRRRAHVYPQVEPRAAALVDRRVAAGRPRAAGRARARGVPARGRPRARAAGRAAWRARPISRAPCRWGSARLPVDAVAWSALPVVGAAAPEIEVRRLLAAGAPMVLVREGRRVVGVIERDRAGVDGAAMSLAARLDHLQSPRGRGATLAAPRRREDRREHGRAGLRRRGLRARSAARPRRARHRPRRGGRRHRLRPAALEETRRRADRARGIRDGVDRGRGDRGGRDAAAAWTWPPPAGSATSGRARCRA